MLRAGVSQLKWGLNWLRSVRISCSIYWRLFAHRLKLQLDTPCSKVLETRMLNWGQNLSLCTCLQMPLFYFISFCSELFIRSPANFVLSFYSDPRQESRVGEMRWWNFSFQHFKQWETTWAQTCWDVAEEIEMFPFPVCVPLLSIFDLITSHHHTSSNLLNQWNLKEILRFHIKQWFWLWTLMWSLIIETVEIVEIFPAQDLQHQH